MAAALFAWLASYEFFHNLQRLHALPAYKSPNEYLVTVEATWSPVLKVVSRYMQLTSVVSRLSWNFDIHTGKNAVKSNLSNERCRRWLR